MLASVRTPAVAATQQRFATAEAPPGLKAGDHLYALHASVGGSIANMTEPSPGTWQLIVSGDEGTDSLHSKIWRSVLTSVDDEYSVGQDLEGVLTLVAIPGAASGAPVVEADDFATGETVVVPGATPLTASGIELRWVAGFASLSAADPNWSVPGFDGIAEGYTGRFATSALAWRTVTSTAPLPEVVFTAPDASVDPGHGYTIIIPSAGGTPGGGQAPTPPTFPASTPGKGTAWMRYTVHDMLTGAYRGDFYPSGVVLDRRIGEPGTWKGRLSLTNTLEGKKINEILPRDPNELTSGPGRLVIHTWRGGTLWGLHWLHTIVTTKDQRGSVTIDLQASTLDGYMLHVALEEAIELSGDQITNARDLIAHMQATSASNAGLALGAPTSGEARPLIAVPGVNVTYGQILQNYARQAGGFEHVINPRVVDGSIVRSWEWGAPIISNVDAEHVFTEGTEGGDITSWREERSVLRGGTRWGAYGGTPEQVDATVGSTPVRSALVETPHIEAGHPIVDRRVQHPTDTTDQGTIDDYAAYWASKAAGAPPVFSADVVIGKNSTLDPNGLGDYIKYKLNNPRYPIINGASSFNLRQRLLGWELTPAERGSGGKDRVKLITEQASEGGE